MRGRATSFAPISSGMKKFPRPDGIAGMMNRKIITDPWRVNRTLYTWSLKICCPGTISLIRIRRPKTPPTRKKRSVVRRYRTPIRLWSRVKAKDRKPFSSRYPRDRPGSVILYLPPLLRFSPYAMTPSGIRLRTGPRLFQRLDISDDRGDVVSGEAPLEGRHDVGEPLHDLRPRVVDGLPDVLLVRGNLAVPFQVYLPAENPLEGGTHLDGPVGGVAPQAAGLRKRSLPFLGKRQGGPGDLPDRRPFRVFLGGHHDQLRPHRGMSDTAVLRAEDVVGPFLVGLEVQVGVSPGKDVLLEPEVREEEPVDDVPGGHDELDGPPRGHPKFVGLHPAVGVLELEEELLGRDVDVACAGCGRVDVPVDHVAVGKKGEHHKGRDQDPDDLENEVARHVGGRRVLRGLLPAVPDGEIDEKPFDQEKEKERYDGDEEEDGVDLDRRTGSRLLDRVRIRHRSTDSPGVAGLRRFHKAKYKTPRKTSVKMPPPFMIFRA